MAASPHSPARCAHKGSSAHDKSQDLYHSPNKSKPVRHKDPRKALPADPSGKSHPQEPGGDSGYSTWVTRGRLTSTVTPLSLTRVFGEQRAPCVSHHPPPPPRWLTGSSLAGMACWDGRAAWRPPSARFRGAQSGPEPGGPALGRWAESWAQLCSGPRQTLAFVDRREGCRHVTGARRERMAASVKVGHHGCHEFSHQRSSPPF